MHRIITIFSLFLAFTGFMNAQDKRNCAAMDVLDRQLQEDPAMRQRLEDIERHTHAFEATPHTHNRAVVTIPVVVHVVYRNGAENISDAQILSQIDVLNKDFRKLNTDINRVPGAFAPLAADSEVEFCLARRDPNGNASTGIMRYSSTRTTDWGTNDAVKKPASGGVAPWDATKYLNMWVCSIGSGILGYAQFPGGSLSTDGVVVDYRYFGLTSNAPYNLGRTMTHEVGHWLNLRHIWGDANCGNDLVSDTPTQQTSNGGCPTFPKVTCSNGPNGDMFMNYMDYVNDDCMHMFTLGQKARMQALFATGGFRASLLTSDGCVPPTPGVCSAPTGVTATNITASAATVSWSAASGASSYVFEYRAVGAASFTASTVSSTSVSLSGLTANTTYEYRVSTNCGTTTSAATTVATFTTTAAPVTCTDIYESNNTRNTAKPITVNSSINALINTTSDNDYFSFSNTTAARNIRVTLTGIPAGTDYDLRLYRGSTVVASSLNTGNTDEKLVLNNGTVTAYTVRVNSYAGSSASQCYTLTVNIGSTTFTREIGETDSKVFNQLVVSPNPVDDVLNVEWMAEKEAPALIRLFDVTGREVSRLQQVLSKEKSIVPVNVQDLSNGLYIISVQQDDVIESRKVIVNHR